MWRRAAPQWPSVLAEAWSCSSTCTGTPQSLAASSTVPVPHRQSRTRSFRSCARSRRVTFASSSAIGVVPEATGGRHGMLSTSSWASSTPTLWSVPCLLPWEPAAPLPVPAPWRPKVVAAADVAVAGVSPGPSSHRAAWSGWAALLAVRPRPSWAWMGATAVPTRAKRSTRALPRSKILRVGPLVLSAAHPRIRTSYPTCPARVFSLAGLGLQLGCWSRPQQPRFWRA
mmetsp:Transcript_86704/g.280708  ORF Transcript_86704/g.280708 Transcript_86704/m.280708 type:complete len:228 (+) Transcript_86704:935-1618(+)